MKLGFIGTGKIASAVINGICTSKISFTKIIISPRNKILANKLKKKFKKIIVAKNNQEVINFSDWVFLSITPRVGEKIIKNLKFKTDQTIVSFISTITLAELKKAIKIKVKIIRAIPLPPISFKKGPIPICPPDKNVKKFFDQIGTTVEIKDEKLSNNFWSTSGIMASYYEMQRVMIEWQVKKGIKKSSAQKYITSLFLALSEDAVINSKKDLKYLVKDSQTPKGINEQVLKNLLKLGFYKILKKGLNNIYKRFEK
jgi:pyrroline-5-carboxylate reductase